MTLDPPTIGRRIADARKRKAWTQLDFAYNAGVSPSAVQRWERGDLPRIKRLMEVAALLEIPVDELVDAPRPQASGEASAAARYARIEAELAAIRGQLAQLLKEEARPEASEAAQGPAR